MVNKSVDILFPGQCLVCGQTGTRELDICIACQESLPRNDPCCSRCALPLTSLKADGVVCGDCARQPPAFERIIAPWRYEAPLDRLMQDLKFRHRLPVGRLLGELLASQIPSGPLPSLLLPVPQHPRQLHNRGFNHSSEITLALSRSTGIPWSPWLLKKIRRTNSQHDLSRQERLKNLKGAFSFDNSSRHRHVAVIDDIVTTGATAREITCTLKHSGVRQVEFWAIARTPIQR
ncbi:ComF family protein [Thiolapillus brandeum]|uniref:Competence protein F n=1 Tax=Thiolapillus brandeum TaxID=1076588 RepID=A0A7U6GJZ4_9GAMM|nr:ComF family protein [Thiolapillus brandeum]BAO44967.1 competence protein F [Thiolapillus brandeum]